MRYFLHLIHKKIFESQQKTKLYTNPFFKKIQKKRKNTHETK